MKNYNKLTQLDWSVTKQEIANFCTPEWCLEMVKEHHWNKDRGGVLQSEIYGDKAINLVLDKIPSLNTLFEPLGLHPKYAGFAGFGKIYNAIHIDLNTVCRVNIPVLNCETSTTVIYRKLNENDDRHIHSMPNGKKYVTFNEDEVEAVDCFILDCPTAIRVGEPHTIKVFGKEPRISLSFSFHESCDFLLED